MNTINSKNSTTALIKIPQEIKLLISEDDALSIVGFGKSNHQREYARLQALLSLKSQEEKKQLLIALKEFEQQILSQLLSNKAS